MTKGWVCPKCGLDYETISPSDAEVAVRSFPRRYAELLTPLSETPDGDRRLRTRPAPETWSAIEYGAHVADIFQELAHSLEAMVRDEHPTIDSGFDPDQAADERRYNERSLEQVLTNLAEGSAAVAAALEGVDAQGWSRTATFSFGERDVLAIARNAVHEGSHHLRDVRDVLAAVR